MRALWLAIVAVALGLSIWADISARRGEYGEWWYPVPGFFSLLGVSGCAAIVAISKLLGHYWLQRREDYYGDGKQHE